MSRSWIWYLNRLRSMSAAEVVHRFAERTRKAHARRTLSEWTYVAAPGVVPALPGLRDCLTEASEASRREIASAARNVLDGNFAAVGRTWPRRSPENLFPPDLWFLDPVTGGAWPGADTFCFEVAYRHEETLGDAKYVWELSKLQFLQPLAADFAINGNSAALNAIEDAIHSWADSNPPLRGINWADTMSVAVRAISLAVVATLCGAALSERTVDRLRGLLRVHADFGRRFPSRFSSANNHLIGELTARFLVGAAMPPSGAGEQDRCWEELMREAVRQIHADGVGAEQSPSYGAFVVECLLLVGLVGRSRGRNLPGQVVDRLDRFAEAIFWMANGNAVVPHLCDNDEGTLLSLCRPEPQYPVSVAAGVVGYLGKPVPGSFRLQPTLREVFFPRSTSGAAPLLRGVRVFADGGLTVVRDTAGEALYILTFDHGSLGYLSIAAHGHADALAIAVDVDDRPVLVDPGTYLYHSGGAWRDWFRGTPAHSTLNIDGQNQSTISGTFNWSRKAVASLDEVDVERDWKIRASHDGYVKRFKVRHERSIERRAAGFVVRDKLLGDGDSAPAAEIVFQLAAGLDVASEGRSVTISAGGRRLAVLEFAPAGEIGIAEGGAIGAGGWVSERFGEKQPAPRVTWRGRIPSSGLETFVRLALARD